MASIEEMIKKSTCFGVAYDGSVRECKICEVKLKCENKYLRNLNLLLWLIRMRCL